MLVVAAIGAFVGTLLTDSVFTAIFASERIRNRRRRQRRSNRPYAL